MRKLQEILKNINTRKVLITSYQMVMAMLFSFLLFLVDFYNIKYIFFLLFLIIGNTIIYFRYLKKQHKSSFIVLEVLLMIFVLMIGYSILTYGYSHIHSDTATATLLLQSIWENKNPFPKTWNYANGETWFLQLLADCFLPTIILKNKAFARAIGSLIAVLILIVSIVLVSKKLFKNKSYLFSIPLFFLFSTLGSSFTADVPTIKDVLFYQCAYSPGIYAVLFSIVLSYLFIFKNDTFSGIFLSIILFCRCITGIRNVAQIVAPIIIATFVFVMVDSKEKLETIKLSNYYHIIKKVLFLVLFSIGGYIIHFILSIYINNVDSLQLTFDISVSSITDKFVRYLKLLYDCYGVDFNNLRSPLKILKLVYCTLIMFAIPLLQLIDYRKANSGSQYFMFYSLAHCFIWFFGMIAFDKISVHYILSSLLLCNLLSYNYIFNKIEKYFSDKRIVLELLLVFIVAYPLYDFLSLSNGYKQELESKYRFVNELTKRNIKKLYGNYWDVYPIQVYSNLDIKCGAVGYSTNENGLSYYMPGQRYGLNDSKWYIPQENVQTAIIMDDKLRTNLLSKEYLYLSNPVDSFICNEYEVFVYDFDIAQVLYNGLEDNVVYPAELQVSEGCAEVYHDQIVLHHEGSAYGPYSNLKKGVYNVCVSGFNIEESTITINSSSPDEYYNYELISKDDESIMIKLDAFDKIEDVEFLIYNKTSEDMFIYKIEVY